MSEIIVALLALLGSAVGSLAGIYANNKMVMYRIEQLESTFKEEHIVSRMQALESHDSVVDSRLNDLEDENKRIISDIKQLKVKV